MSIRQLAVLSLATLSLGACTTSMETRPVASTATRVDGVEYSLPALELEFAVTHRLIDCAEVDVGASGKEIVPEFEMKIEPKQEMVPSETFEMDYSKLSRGWKTSKFVVEWHDNRMLKSINTSATDKSSAIILETLKAGISIAKLAGGIPPVAGMAGAKGATCPAQIQVRKNLLVQRKKDVKGLEAQNGIVEAFNARSVTATLSEEDKKALSAALAAAKTHTDAIADLDKKLAQLDKVLALTETIRWRPASNTEPFAMQRLTRNFTLPDNPTAIEEVARAKWIKGLFGLDNLFSLGFGGPGCEANVDENGVPQHFRCRLVRSLSMDVWLMPYTPGGSAEAVEATRTALGIKAEESGTPEKKADHVRGVVTRTPVRARLIACQGLLEACHGASTNKLVDQNVTVPQVGHYVVLPFSNGFGQDNALVATFAPDGTPTKVDYQDKEAALLVAAQTVNQTAQTVLTYEAELRSFREAEKEKQEGAALKAAEAEVKLLEQQRKLIDLQYAVSPASVDVARQKAALQSQLGIAQLYRDIAKIEDEIASLSLQAAARPGDLALQAELDRLNKELSIVRSSVEIAKLCASYPEVARCSS